MAEWRQGPTSRSRRRVITAGDISRVIGLRFLEDAGYLRSNARCVPKLLSSTRCFGTHLAFAEKDKTNTWWFRGHQEFTAEHQMPTESTKCFGELSTHSEEGENKKQRRRTRCFGGLGHLVLTRERDQVRISNNECFRGHFAVFTRRRRGIPMF